MAYTSKSSKPNEFANKSNHSEIINDLEVQNFLGMCTFPEEGDAIDLDTYGVVIEQSEVKKNPISIIIAIDGGYTDVEVKKSFPSSRIAFFQFGAFWLNLEEWKNIGNGSPFISPEIMSTFNDLQRIKLVLPSKNVVYDGSVDYVTSFRKTLYDFFMKNPDKDSNLMETLAWLIFEEYNSNVTSKEYELQSPTKEEKIFLKKAEMKSDYTFDVNGEIVYLTDIFRLHEIVDEELGASGALGYITSVVEQLLITHYIQYMLKVQPTFLNKTLFIRDGSLAFTGQTARLHRAMRKLISFLNKKNKIYLVGLEKSGNFVEHAHEITKEILTSSKDEGIVKAKPNIKSKLQKGTTLLLSNEYIYKYVRPGDHTKSLFGDTSYYSGKIIHKSKNGNVYVASIPTLDKTHIENPKREYYLNLDVILDALDNIKCDMYDNSIVPIALANRLVSLANHPSKTLLEKFAKAQSNT